MLRLLAVAVTMSSSSCRSSCWWLVSTFYTAGKARADAAPGIDLLGEGRRLRRGGDEKGIAARSCDSNDLHHQLHDRSSPTPDSARCLHHLVRTPHAGTGVSANRKHLQLSLSAVHVTPSLNLPCGLACHALPLQQAGCGGKLQFWRQCIQGRLSRMKRVLL